MEARGYNENRTDPRLAATPKDALLSGIVALICLLSYYVN
jgi:hypothetical protein